MMKGFKINDFFSYMKMVLIAKVCCYHSILGKRKIIIRCISGTLFILYGYSSRKEDRSVNPIISSEPFCCYKLSQ